MPVRLSHSPDRDGEWRVSLNDTVIVCFSGPSAREQALRRSRELTELLRSITDESGDTHPSDAPGLLTPG